MWHPFGIYGGAFLWLAVAIVALLLITGGDVISVVWDISVTALTPYCVSLATGIR